jgi:hypothetical protein
VDRMRAGCAFGRGAGICAYFGESTTGKADDAIGHGGSENGGHAVEENISIFERKHGITQTS